MTSHLQAAVRQHHPGACIIGLLFYSDSSDIGVGNLKIRPLQMYIANFTLSQLRSQDGGRRVADLPGLDAKQLRLSEKSDR